MRRREVPRPGATSARSLPASEIEPQIEPTAVVVRTQMGWAVGKSKMNASTGDGETLRRERFYEEHRVQRTAFEIARDITEVLSGRRTKPGAQRGKNEASTASEGGLFPQVLAIVERYIAERIEPAPRRAGPKKSPLRATATAILDPPADSHRARRGRGRGQPSCRASTAIGRSGQRRRCSSVRTSRRRATTVESTSPTSYSTAHRLGSKLQRTIFEQLPIRALLREERSASISRFSTTGKSAPTNTPGLPRRL